MLAHLIGGKYDAAGGEDTPRSAWWRRCARRSNCVKGTYGIAIMHQDAARTSSSARAGAARWSLGSGKGENFLASDVSAIVRHTREAVYLNDGDIAALTPDSFEITSLAGGGQSSYEVSQVDFAEEEVEQGEFPHFMLKEIFEQPESIPTRCAAGFLGGGHRETRRPEHDAGGTARGRPHHPLRMRHRQPRGDGRRIPDRDARAHPERGRVRERIPLPQPADRQDTLVFVISQSGETTDTLAALREGQRKGHRALGICNNVASTIARESDGGVYMHAGPEIGVAATKSFTSQVTILTLLGAAAWAASAISARATGSRSFANLQAIPREGSAACSLRMNGSKPSPGNMRAVRA